MDGASPGSSLVRSFAGSLARGLGHLLAHILHTTYIGHSHSAKYVSVAWRMYEYNVDCPADVTTISI